MTQLSVFFFVFGQKGYVFIKGESQEAISVKQSRVLPILTRVLVVAAKGVSLYPCVVWSVSFLPEAVESGREGSPARTASSGGGTAAVPSCPLLPLGGGWVLQGRAP